MIEMSGQSDSSSQFSFRELIKDVPLAEDEADGTPHITCVEYWDGNLYIGGSHGQLLHFVSLPGEDVNEPPTFILASRQEPESIPSQTSDTTPGVQQILLLPSAKKACVVCNHTLTFYTLPELSPAYGGKIKQGDCNFVGGIDENKDFKDGDDVVIIICLKQRLRLIKIGEQARKVRDIEVPGCLQVRRRGDLACVADERSYSLLDVVNQRKIDLFPVTSVPAIPDRTPSPQPRRRPPGEQDRPRPVSMHFPSVSPIRDGERRGHERISSLGAQPRNTDRLTPDSPTHWPSRRSSRQFSPGRDGFGSPLRSQSPLASRNVESESPADVPATPIEGETFSQDAIPLRPLILSPTPDEFLLTTGTISREPGVGMFVNEEGDVSRGTVEFSKYPRSIVLDSLAGEESNSSPTTSSKAEGDGVLALFGSVTSDESYIEVQAIDEEFRTGKHRFDLPKGTAEAGIYQCKRPQSLPIPAIVSILGLRRLDIGEASQESGSKDRAKAKQEDALIERFAFTNGRCMVFRDSSIWWILEQPLILQLNARLEAAVKSTAQSGLLIVNRSEVQFVFNSLRGREPNDEISFMTLNFIRQKAAILLFLDLLIQTAQRSSAAQKDLQHTQEAMSASDLDPRIVLSMIPALRQEAIEGDGGVWVPGGLRSTVDVIRHNKQFEGLSHSSDAVYWNNVLPLIKSYLSIWRKKKGFGSIADEAHVFQTVDAALLHVLLILDQRSPSGPAVAGSLRAELNEIVDKDVDCFDRAITLLESFHRLYVLSRLYQSRKMFSKVLATWKRILDGEEDLGGELTDGESDVRKYLVRLKDADLVKEYGTWLADRNPPLGVQVFADDNSRVKFTMNEAVDLLKAKAPKAVKYYLEHLVFNKNQAQYATDLINFYLSGLLDTISSDSAVRDSLSTLNEIYLSFPAPKPTFMQFMTDNAPDTEWQRHRTRLLQLLDTPAVSSNTLDISSLTTRLAPFSTLLVPETIILSAQQSEHTAALHLLVHQLGDYDTATRYCLHLGQSPFHPFPPSTSTSSLSAALTADKRLAQQKTLFAALLDEYLSLPPPADLDRASELLERFGGWFDVAAVLGKVPGTWPVQAMEGFLGTALRGLVRERREAGVVRALAAGENLRVAVELVERLEGEKPVVVTGDEGGEKGKSWADSGYGSAGGSQGVDVG